MPTIYRKTLAPFLQTKPAWVIKLVAIAGVLTLPYQIARELFRFYRYELSPLLVAALKYVWTILSASKEDFV